MLTANRVCEALEVCFDPELRINIVDLGLVHGIFIEQDHDAPGFNTHYTVIIDLIMRAPGGEIEAMLVAQIRNRLAGMEEISRSEVRVLREPAWSADRMTDAARRQLEPHRKPKQGLVTIQL